MGVEALDNHKGIIGQYMRHADDLAPTAADILCKYNEAVGAAVDGVAKVGIAAAGAVPVVAQVGVLAEFLGVIVAFGIRRAHGVVEPVGIITGMRSEEMLYNSDGKLGACCYTQAQP